LDGSIPPTRSSLWGGVVILGNARINSAKSTAGNAAAPKFDVYEGVADNPDTGLPYLEHRFGGDNDADNSGSLRYVSIRLAGRIFAQNAELNCLTLGGVGSGTTIEYVEFFGGSDDGIEIWGGTVNTKHLVAAFVEDDDFDTDQGYRGTNQFWFGIKYPGNATGDSRGIESDGDLSQSATGEQPISKWYAYNVTLLGRGKAETAAAVGTAWNTRDEDAPNVFNSVFSGWNQGLILDTDGLAHHTNTTVQAAIQNNLWDVNTGANSAGGFIFSTAAFNNTVGSAMLGAISHTNDMVLDPRPQTGSPVYNDVAAGAPMTVNYRGAFANASDNWADGWSALSQYGYLKPASAAEPVAPMLSIARDAGNIQVSFIGENGVTYRFESSAGLVNWSAIGGAGGSALGQGSTITRTYPASDSARFIRVRATRQ
jgi:hypothetical protein